MGYRVSEALQNIQIYLFLLAGSCVGNVAVTHQYTYYQETNSLNDIALTDFVMFS